MCLYSTHSAHVSRHLTYITYGYEDEIGHQLVNATVRKCTCFKISFFASLQVCKLVQVGLVIELG